MPMPDDAGPMAPDYAALTFLMWFVMMIAMMTPAVAPLVLIFDRSRRSTGATPGLATLAFAAGYFAVWSGFSALVTLLQIGLIRAGIVDAMTMSRRPLWTAGLLLAVGIYQWLPLKGACLEHCRDPIHFLTRHYRPGTRGAFVMGLAHGLYCLGCCWLIMLLLFIGGAMNLLWVAGLTLFVVLEKMFAAHALLRPLTGGAFIVAGLLVAARG